LNQLANAFVERYEVQMRRLVAGALAANKASSIIVFGLINFESFFRARAEAEAKKDVNKRLFPYLENDYRYFISMEQQYRKGIIDLARLFNQRLESCEAVSRITPSPI
jgi:hypothetical protein